MLLDMWSGQECQWPPDVFEQIRGSDFPINRAWLVADFMVEFRQLKACLNYDGKVRVILSNWSCFL